jgi:hypothetical protein
MSKRGWISKKSLPPCISQKGKMEKREILTSMAKEENEGLGHEMLAID